MEIGGAEKALLGLLSAFDYTRFNVDLFLYHHEGELMQFLPEEINLLPEKKSYASLAKPLTQVIRNKAFGTLLGRYLGKNAANEYVAKNRIKDGSYVFIDYSHRYSEMFMPKISDKQYDAVISFLTPHYFAADKVKAKKRIAWIHTDYSYIEIDVASELDMWSRYDTIVSISKKVTEAFVSRFPELEDRIVLVENIHPAGFIKEQAEAFDVSDEMPDDGYIKFLSVGRFSDAKNFDNVPDICSRLDNVKWYIIGYGGDEALIRQKISEAGMEDRVIILGKKVNPYPYFKACDFYVQPSRYEGNSVTVNEALVLGKKVAITNYATAESQIKNGIDGVIVPLENEKCAAALNDFIKDTALQEKILSHVINSDYSKAEGYINFQEILES
ncbi:MAG: glycosyltransferase [Clostridia bacterium]|nr:glycosyltransferase [Clostridia bacterium]